ncbi:flagella synthesis protein FlgN [Stutzerimonas stutzeri]|uniref:flagella synthesis protein FlgN n=1 Tax=Stutzerimonas stutzeri TaxID=316 RepID=UPI000F77B29E|nr:flagellar protein FlgN [Stutzerimonas stutzeri]MDH0184498.1 flagellar protein FlgN [Stutzerimonas stutzeri]MDH0498493.1 flagellar protein FlgN [Stutzerimonas stutzeri]MDH1250128.1 flagellar protein FlgN [Stutzerimonas stutzeri]RRW10085.1 flagellar protein FlgN [Stutzerimonas stutzeri]WGG18411.1 flagellar protein FlgN [Stutzerimonas stutzeri]
MHETALLEQLTEDIGIAHQLLELIDEEFAALGNRDLAGLEAILTKKQPLLALLGQHGAQRSQWLAGQRLSPDRSGFEAAVHHLPNSEVILEQTHLLESMLKDCRSANERNGRLIRANQSALGSTLRILQGETDTLDLYDNRGGPAKTKQQRPLSQA